MKTIGLIGGMSWESSAEYYRILNEETQKLKGGNHSCPCILYSVDFQPIEELQHKERWKELGDLLTTAGKNLADAGAEMILLCTNTMHYASEGLEALPVPFIHIADATGEVIWKKGLKKVGLLGTRFTMEKDFYKNRLLEKWDVETIIPEEKERHEVHRIIYEELVKGIVRKNSREYYLKVIKKLSEAGAEGIILGCTEIPLLIRQEDTDIPVFDTTYIHAMAALGVALE
jgi:aspartate racemase